MSHIREPFKMHVHPKLLHKINGLSIAIKLHHIIKAEVGDMEKIEQAKASHPAPTWDEVVEVLKEAYEVINRITEDPRKY